MAIGIVAPVPSKHLESAMCLAAAGRSVAFGSNKFDVFQDDVGNVKIVSGTRVLIYGSMAPGGRSEWHLPLHATAEAHFVGWERYKSGFYGGEAMRPETTMEDMPRKDTAFIGFWVVNRLVAIKGGFSLSNLRLNGSGRKISLPPRYPMIVDLPS